MKDKNVLFIVIIGILSIIAILSLSIVFIYFKKLNFLGNLINSDYVSIFISGLVAFGTILLAIATFVSLFMSKKEEGQKRKVLLNQFNAEHLKNIKENCLTDLQQEANNKYNSNIPPFKITRRHTFNENSLMQSLNATRHSYDNEIVYEVNYKAIVNNKLYKDLEFHKITKDIPGQFDHVLGLIIEKSPNYLKNLIGLIEKIKKTEGYGELLSNLNKDYTTLILAISLGYPDIKYNFPNLYDSALADNALKNIEKIGNIVADTEEAKASRAIVDEINRWMDVLNKKIEEVFDYDGLLDECGYLKQKRETIL